MADLEQILKMLCHVSGIGVKTISKMLAKEKFTMFELVNMDIEKLKNLAGKDKGTRIFNAFHNIEQE